MFYMLAWWKILNLQLGYVWLSKLHALATGRLYHVTFPSNSTIPLCLHTLLLSELKSTELWVLWMRVPACRTDAQCFCDPTYNVKRRKNDSALGKASKWALYPIFSCSYQVSGVWYIYNSRQKGKWYRKVLLIVLCFPKLCKARELKLHRWSAFMLLGQMW